QMNERNMVQANDRARKVAAEASRSMAIALLAGTAFAGLAVFFLSSAILAPLERMTRAAHDIESGNLDLAVPVPSRDELGRLAVPLAGRVRPARRHMQCVGGRPTRAAGDRPVPPAACPADLAVGHRQAPRGGGRSLPRPQGGAD